MGKDKITCDINDNASYSPATDPYESGGKESATPLPPALPPTQQTSSYQPTTTDSSPMNKGALALTPGQRAFFGETANSSFPLGQVRFFTQPRGSTKLLATWMFPNGDEVEAILNYNQKTGLITPSATQGALTDFASGQTQPIQLTIDQTSSPTVHIFLPAQRKPTNFTEAFQFKLKTDGKDNRLETDAKQPDPLPNHYDRLRPKPFSEEVKVRAIEPIYLPHIGDGHLYNHLITLSNGDQLALPLRLDHHGHGSFASTKSASLNRVTDKTGEAIKLTASGKGQGNGIVTVEDKAKGYFFKFTVTPPKGGRGGKAIIQLKSSSVPPPESASPGKKIGSSFTSVQSTHLDARKGINLLPTRETRDILRHPPFDSGEVHLSFVGEVGGKTIGFSSPVVITGRFIQGKFQPSLKPDETREMIVYSERGEMISLNIERIGHQIGLEGIKINIPLTSSKALTAKPVSLANLVGFSTTPSLVGRLAKFYQPIAITGSSLSVGEEWEQASALTKNEIARIFSRRALNLAEIKRVTQNKKDASLLHVELGDGDLFLKRDALEDQIIFHLIGSNKGSLSAWISSEEGDPTLEGLAWQDTQGMLSTAKLWNGKMTQQSSLPEAFQNETGVRVRLKENHLAWEISREPAHETKGHLQVGEPEASTVNFEMNDGKILQITPPENVEQEELFLSLLEKPQANSTDAPLKVDIIHEDGSIEKAEIISQEGEWILKTLEGEKVVQINLDHNAWPLLQLQKPKEKITAAPPIEEPKPPLSELEETQPIAVSFPADEPPFKTGDFILPSQRTRMWMRGEERTAIAMFEFYGTPHHPAGAFQARVILDGMNRGDRESFFELIVRIPHVFQNGRWIPQEGKEMEVIRRVPHQENGKTVVGEVIGGTYPIHLAENGAIKIGGEELLVPYRVLFKPKTDKPPILSQDLGYSVGSPTERAEDQLEILERVTGAIHSYLPPRPPTPVEATVTEGVTTHIRPIFGDPIYRSHIRLSGKSAMVEFSPGYFQPFATGRFTQFRIYNGSHLDWRITFQHQEAGVNIIGLELNGKAISTRDLAIRTLADGSSEFSLIQPGNRKEQIRLSLTWKIGSSGFQINHFGFGEERFDLHGVTPFHIREWDLQRIRAKREGRELVLTGAHRKSLGGIPRREGPSPKESVIVFPPVNEPELATPSSHEKNTVWASYPVEPEKGDSSDILKIPFKYNPDQQSYEPIHSNSLITARLKTAEGEEDVAIPCQATHRERHWRLLLPPEIMGDVRQANLGNFATRQTFEVAQGRPTPVLWLSKGLDPHHRAANSKLIEMGLIPPTVFSPIKLESNGEFVATFLEGADRYEIPMRLVTIPGQNKRWAIPTKTATKLNGNDEEKMWVTYYLPYRSQPAAIELSNGQERIAFELPFGRTPIGRVPTLGLRKTHAGVIGLRSEGRTTRSMTLTPSQPSEFLFVDLNEKPFYQEVEATLMQSRESVIVRRVVMNAITGESYEFVFDAVRAYGSSSRLSLAGIAYWNLNKERTIIPTMVLRHEKMIRARIEGNHYFTILTTPETALNVKSRGSVEEEDLLLSESWFGLLSPSSIFSEEPELPTPFVPKLFFQTAENRRQVRAGVSGDFGIEEGLLWDFEESEFPHGLVFNREIVGERIIYSRGRKGGQELRIEHDRSGWPPKNIRVFYDGIELSHEFMMKEGRPFLRLGNSLDTDKPIGLPGVILYWGVPKPGVHNLVEGSHREYRWALERAMGYKNPIPGPNTEGVGKLIHYVYPPVNETALQRQLARSRLEKLRTANVLPTNSDAQIVLSNLLIPQQEQYDLRKPPELLSLFEDISADPTFHAIAKQMLLNLSEKGSLPAQIDSSQLKESWEFYRVLKNDPSYLSDAINEANKIAKVLGEIASMSFPPITKLEIEILESSEQKTGKTDKPTTPTPKKPPSKEASVDRFKKRLKELVDKHRETTSIQFEMELNTYLVSAIRTQDPTVQSWITDLTCIRQEFAGHRRKSKLMLDFISQEILSKNPHPVDQFIQRRFEEWHRAELAHTEINAQAREEIEKEKAELPRRIESLLKILGRK